MELEDAKIDIVSYFNDQPSKMGDPIHPNGANFCSQHNNLIEVLETKFENLPEILTNDGFPLTKWDINTYLYVDLSGGDDSADGLSDTTPFLTLEKALETLSQYAIYQAYISIKGVLTDPVIDITKIKSSAISLDDYWWEEGSDHFICLKAWDTGLTIHTTHIGVDNTKPLIASNNRLAVRFDEVSFTFGDNSEPIYLNRCTAIFSSCTFTEPATSNFYDGFLWVTDCQTYFGECTFTGGAISGYVAIAGERGTIIVYNNEYTDYNAVYLEDGTIIIAGDNLGTFNTPDEGDFSGTNTKIYFERLKNYNFANYDFKDVLAHTPKWDSVEIVARHNAVQVNGNRITLGRNESFSPDSRINKNTAEQTFSFQIPANSLINVRFEKIKALFGNIKIQAVMEDPTVNFAYWNFESLWMFFNDYFAGTDGSGVLHENTHHNDTANFIVNHYIGSDFNGAHDSNNDNSNYFNFVKINSATGSYQGATLDNYYGYPINFMIKINLFEY